MDQKLVLIGFGRITDTIGSQKTLIARIKSPESTAYISPEQLIGMTNFTSDIYSIGIIAIQAITGKHPDELQKDFETADIVWHDSVQKKLNPKLEETIKKMVYFSPKSRYPSVQELLETLMP